MAIFTRVAEEGGRLMGIRIEILNLKPSSLIAKAAAFKNLSGQIRWIVRQEFGSIKLQIKVHKYYILAFKPFGLEF